MKFPWQQRKIKFRADKTEKNVSRSKVRKNLLQKKILIFFSQVLKRRLLSFLGKNYWHGCQNCNLRTFRRFWGLTIFENCTMCNLLGLWDEKSKGFSRKSLFRVFATGYHASRGISWGKVISPNKKFYSFLYHFWRWSIFLSFCKLLLSGVSKHRFKCVEKKWEKVTLRKLLFYHFWTLSGKNLDCQQNSKAWFSKL